MTKFTLAELAEIITESGVSAEIDVAIRRSADGAVLTLKFEQLDRHDDGYEDSAAAVIDDLDRRLRIRDA